MSEDSKILAVSIQEPTNADENNDEDEFVKELKQMKLRYEEMEREAQKLQELQAQNEKEMTGVVDYSSTPEEVQAYFQACGIINRVTILCDKFTGHPKGFAYVEFASPDSVNNAVLLNESPFKGRLLKVTPKRTNVPAFLRGGARGGRPYRGGFRGRGFGFPIRGRASAFSTFRGRGRGVPGGYFAPY
ncbi:cytoplasmic RNA-binding protein [Nowakowskiella sp. JEL0078]|nr:cytoplasmic RNA-binding protein [Nowakowskiella sp. JEL0078]